jgi:hypothetical protein
LYVVRALLLRAQQPPAARHAPLPLEALEVVEVVEVVGVLVVLAAQVGQVEEEVEEEEVAKSKMSAFMRKIYPMLDFLGVFSLYKMSSLLSEMKYGRFQQRYVKLIINDSMEVSQLLE